MHALTFGQGLLEDGLSVLLLGAHCDDIEIGCGATVLRLAEQVPHAEFHWVVLSSDSAREAEARAAASAFLGQTEGANIVIKAFRDGYFPYHGGEVKDLFEELKASINPDLIFTHYRHDAHQDHRLVSELTWNTWRDHLILEYEVPKFDGDLGSPNVFVDADEAARAEKLRILADCYGSQRSRRWFTNETFLGLMRLRGIECNAPSGHAEGFYCRKVPLAF
jgi:LmbE family N-acetylglucosaminyl deacetylase